MFTCLEVGRVAKLKDLRLEEYGINDDGIVKLLVLSEP